MEMELMIIKPQLMAKGKELEVEFDEAFLKDLLYYQMDMVSHNLTGKVYPMDFMQLDNRCRLQIRLDEKISLEEYLLDHTPSVNHVILMIRHIAEIMLYSRNYFLFAESFFLDVKYVYIHPVSMDISMVYLPFTPSSNLNKNWEDFLTRLSGIAKEIHPGLAESFEELAAHTRQKDFSLRSLCRQLGQIRANLPHTAAGSDSEQKVSFTIRCEESAEKNDGSFLSQIAFSFLQVLKPMRKTLLFVFVQVLTLLALFLCRDWIKGLNDGNTFSTYILLGTILVPANILLMKKLFK